MIYLLPSEYSDGNSKEKIWKEMGEEMKQPGMSIRLFYKLIIY